MSKYGYDFDLFGNPEYASEQSDATINDVTDEQSDALINEVFDEQSDAPIIDAPINEDMTSEVSASTVAGDFSAASVQSSQYSQSTQYSQSAQSSQRTPIAQPSASSSLPEICLLYTSDAADE